MNLQETQLQIYMNSVSLLLINIHQYINFYLLFLIPCALSVFFEKKWIKSNVIEDVGEHPLSFSRVVLYICCIFATVSTYNIMLNFKIPLISVKFLIAFLFLSFLWGTYLLFIRIKFKF